MAGRNEHIRFENQRYVGKPPAQVPTGAEDKQFGRGTSIAQLSWLLAWHIRDETYSKALARIVNYYRRQPFTVYWGEGTTSSSDGQRFRAGGRGEQSGQVNLRYGTEPGVLFYTHVSDQYAPFHTKVINATVRDATHVLAQSVGCLTVRQI